MAEYLIQDTTLTSIANAIRTKTDKSDAILVSDMASEILEIPSGMELNFTVVGDTSQPSGRENTIWVNTSTPITTWIFSASEPTSPVSDMVWISIGTSSSAEFNALKTNGIQVYPISANQYIGGAWVEKTAKIWKNRWVDFVMCVFKDGEILLGEISSSTPTRLYVENGELVFKNSNGNGSWGYFTESADLTNYKKLKAKIKQSSVYNTNYALVSVTSQIPTAETLANIKKRSETYLELTVKDGVYHELETSVDGLSGAYYIEVAAIAVGAISEIWFE